MIKRFGIKITPSIYDEAPSDEVDLAQQARDLNAALTIRDNTTDYTELSKQYSPNLATRCIYERAYSENQTFIETINRQEIPTDYQSLSIPNDLKILLVPGLFYRQHPEVGADGALIEAIAKRFNIPLSKAGVDSLGSIEANTKILRDIVESEVSNSLWLVSISKGGSEVANLFQTCAQQSKVKGWINIAGINAGSPHIPRKLGNPIRRAWYRALSKAIGLDYHVLEELHPQHPLWHERHWPRHIEMIHVTPMPLRAHVQPTLRKRYDKISKLGPNDGFVLLEDVFAIPGKIYPMWGVDHFFRAPHISELVYKLFAYVVAQSNYHNKENNNEILAHYQRHPHCNLSMGSR